jgi:UDP-glucose 4-epimerase
MHARRILVTGGAGFIGSHLVERLLADGARVHVLDDLSTGSLENLSTASDHPALSVERGSVLDRDRVRALTQDCDQVVHLAAVVGVRRVLERPLETLTVNLDGTRNVLEAAAESGIPALLASSSEVYGDRPSERLRESDPVLLGPTHQLRWVYAASKAVDEWLAAALAAERGLVVDLVRFFNIAGPRQVDRHGMALPTFVRQALEGQPLTVHGDGSQKRCLCHVADAVEALQRLLTRTVPGGARVNVGSEQEIAIADLASLVSERVGRASPIVQVPLGEAYGQEFEDVRGRVPDLTALERLTGFRPELGIERIVSDVIEFERARA